MKIYTKESLIIELKKIAAKGWIDNARHGNHGGIGAPEREGWVSVGRMRESGIFSIKQNDIRTVDFRPPTHWRVLTE